MNSNESVNNDARIDTLVEKLKGKLNNFVVVDKQGEVMGQVKDLTLDTNRQLNLVISRITNDQSNQLFLLISKLIQKIDPPNNLVSANINKSQIEHLPEYVPSETIGREFFESLDNLAVSTNRANKSMTQNSEHLFKSPNILDETDYTVATGDSNTVKEWGEEVIRLLGERLIVDRSKRKVGEVVIRKEIEMRMVQVPVRYEKLIVEQIGSENKQLAEIELGKEEIPGIELNETATTSAEVTNLDGETVKGEFKSPKIASLLLNAIAQERRHGCKKIRIEVVVEDTERQQTYQEWFDRCTQ